MKLELYHRWNCPYSGKVRDYIQNHQLFDQLTLIELSEVPEARESLMALTGKTQVPCLVIDGRPMFESDDIVKWLEDHFSSVNYAH